MQQTTVDVIIPAYNAQEFILQAIHSVKSQSYPARIIVVDDGSTDETARLVNDRFATDPAVRYIYKDNGGLSSARNRGFAESSAEFVAFLDADDLWVPNKLADQLEVFRRTGDPKLGVVYCDFENIDSTGFRLLDKARFQLDRSVRGEVFTQLLCGNYVAGSGSAVLIKRACFQSAGVFDEEFPTCEDWDMWLRLARYY